MDNHVTLRTAKERLDSQNMRYAELALGGGFTALITQYGGRLLGPFLGDAGESLLWMCKEFGDAAAFQNFVRARSWNLGGERLWVNPELKFFCQSPETFDKTYTVQPALDPGSYELTWREGSVELSQNCALKVLGTGEEKTLLIERRYAPAANPLESLASLKGIAVDYCGYQQDVLLKDTSPQFPLALEPWILSQINPGGKVVTPFFGEFEFVDYYEPVGDLQRVRDGYAELDITGRDKYKVAYRSAQTFGRMAYAKDMGDRWQLMMRNYYNDPSIPYISEPWGDLGNRGCSVYYYNDHGSVDGFAEFENSGPVVGEKAGRTQSFNTSSVWFFFGGRAEIHRIMEALLGIDYKF